MVVSLYEEVSLWLYFVCEAVSLWLYFYMKWLVYGCISMWDG